MIVTHNWLKEFVNFELSPEELAHRLTMAGLEVDVMQRLGEGLEDVVVARLASVEPHPEADRLTVCAVDNGKEILQVVCGARNHRPGDLVALAQVGAVLPGEFKIKKSKIRGRDSMGMLCSEKELGLAQESEGILILPPGLPLGTPIFEALGRKDVRFELGLTPNRGDCLSVLGVAREVAAMVGQPVRLPKIEVREDGNPIEAEISVTVEAPGMCPRYAARVIRGATIGPSPEWLVRKLESVGLRSINNVVDVTNLILLELGHPLHAFDFNLVRGRRIVVRLAGEGEVFTTLDSQPRTLRSRDLTICDGGGPVALAGIMGGENSEIRPETTDLLLESAYFDRMTIRRTSKRLGLHTESSHRFERGADIDMVPFALDRAAALIQELAGGTVARGRIDVYPTPVAERRLTITARRTEEILGIRLDPLEIRTLLRSIGLGAELAPDREEALVVTVPSFRSDLEREIDLIEEVARLNGYDRIPVTMPSGRALCHRPPLHRRGVTEARNAMVSLGFSEVINYSFVSPALWDRIALAADDPRRLTVKVLNPLTEEQSVMRTTLVPTLLETVSRNLAYRTLDQRLFELRPVFLPQEGEELPCEKVRLTAVGCGRRHPEGWAQGNESIDFFDLKGIAETLLHSFHLPRIFWEPSAGENFFHPGKSCTIRCGDLILGTLGEVHPTVLAAFDIQMPLVLLDLDMETVLAAAGGPPKFRPLSRFPDIYRDSAFLLDEGVSASQVFETVEKAKGKDVEEIILFDLYRGPGIPDGKKSFGLRIRYRSAEKTLTDEEINRTHGRLVQALCDRLNAEIR